MIDITNIGEPARSFVMAFNQCTDLDDLVNYVFKANVVLAFKYDVACLSYQQISKCIGNVTIASSDDDVIAVCTNIAKLLLSGKGHSTSGFQREVRYLVLKTKDINAFLCDQDRDKLMEIVGKIDQHRLEQGRGLLRCVVVEEDWTPAYEQTWDLIENLVNQ